MPFKDYVPEGEVPTVSKGQVFMDYVPEPKPELVVEEVEVEEPEEEEEVKESLPKKGKK